MQAVKIAAAGLGGLLLLGVAGWSVMGRRPTVVPLIEADSRPIRVRPENPGGMQVAGADEQVLGEQARSGEKMAPPTEVPAPQALRAQMPPVLPATAPASATVAAAPAAPMATPLAEMHPVAPAKPASQPAPVTSVPTPAPVPAAAMPSQTAATGAMLVQLGALPSEAAAQAEWQRLAKSAPELIGNRQATIQKIDRDGRAFWRLRTGGFADVADATSFCAKLHAKGGSCAIASF